jgi:hypothetical protein
MTSQLTEPDQSSTPASPETTPLEAPMLSTRDTEGAAEVLQVLPAVPASLRHSRAGFAAWLAGLGGRPITPTGDPLL